MKLITPFYTEARRNTAIPTNASPPPVLIMCKPGAAADWSADYSSISFVLSRWYGSWTPGLRNKNWTVCKDSAFMSFYSAAGSLQTVMQSVFNR